MLTHLGRGYPTGPAGLVPRCLFYTARVTPGPARATPGGAQRTFELEATSVGLARRFVATTLAAWGATGYTDPAVSICSELATNAVLHARTPFSVRLQLLGARLRLEVADGSAQAPRPRNYSTKATTGRGLGMVAALASDWGTTVHGSGKRVWVELARAATSDDLGGHFTDDVDGLSVRERSRPACGAQVRGRVPRSGSRVA